MIVVEIEMFRWAVHGMWEIRDSGDDKEDEGRSKERCWAALLVIGRQAPKSRASFFLFLKICRFAVYFFPPSAVTVGPAVELVRMSGGEMQRRLGCARADPDDHSGRVKVGSGLSRALRQSEI